MIGLNSHTDTIISIIVHSRQGRRDSNGDSSSSSSTTAHWQSCLPHATDATTMPHRPTLLIVLKLLFIVGGPFAFLLSPTVVRRTSAALRRQVPGLAPDAAAAAGAGAAAAAAAVVATPSGEAGEVSRERRERVLQTCVREEGFYDGEWVHRPQAFRPYAHYAWGLRFHHHQFFDGAFERL
jgi:hypothetical protein